MAQFNNLDHSAYGGPDWSPRLDPLRTELGTIWIECGINSEYTRLKAVLLHRPGDELAASENPQSVQMLSPIDVEKAKNEHDALAETYRNAGVEALEESGYKVLYLPDQEEAVKRSGFNFVTIGPREIVMPSHNPQLQSYLEGHDVICHIVNVSELIKAGGAIGCLTGVLYREPV